MILNVIRTGWMNLRRDRAALMLSFAVPIVFFSIFATIFGSRGGQTTPKIKVALVDEDHTPRSAKLIAAFQHESSVILQIQPPKGKAAFDRAAAAAYVRAGDAPVALVIPKGFGTSAIRFGSSAAGTRPRLEMLADSSDPIAPQVINGLLQKNVMTALPDMFMNAGVEQFDRWSGGFTPQQKSNLDQKIHQFNGAEKQTGVSSGQGQSFVDVKTTDLLGEKKKNPLAAFYAAGIGVMFLLFTATAAGGALLDESENGTLDRLLTTRLSLTQLLVGKLLYLSSLGLVQLMVMFVWGAVAFKVELWSHLAGFFLMAIPTALACSAFGLLMASISRSRAQLSAISTMTVLSMSALGGSMFPRFLMPEGMQRFSLIAFNSWALEGFTKVFWREEPLVSLWPQVLVLLGTTILFFAIARKLTRRWEIS